MRRLGSAVLVLVFVLTGCSAAPERTASNDTAVNQPAADQNGPNQPAGKPAPPDQTGLPESVPTEIRIPKIGATSSLIPLGLNADETVQVPPVTQPMQAGWYDHAPTPGEIGPAIILGHVDGNKTPGIFYRLHDLKPGDEVHVSRQDGSTVRFAVSRVVQVAKSRFPTDEVYGDTTGPELRLITCGGTFDKAAHSYEDNIIVYAKIIA